MKKHVLVGSVSSLGTVGILLLVLISSTRGGALWNIILRLFEFSAFPLVMLFHRLGETSGYTGDGQIILFWPVLILAISYYLGLGAVIGFCLWKVKTR